MNGRSGRAPVLVFDVLGSLLDEDAGQLAAVQAEPALQAVAAQDFVTQWSARFHELVTAIRGGRELYAPPEALYARAANEVGELAHLTLTEHAVTQLARFGRALPPFPEVPAALDTLGRRHALVALTNAGSAQALAMSHHAGLRWSTIISGESVQAYKPDPRMYRHVITTLDLQPERCVFIAAHPWDLDAAARHGFATAHLDRAGAGHHVAADFQAPDLAALAAQLC